MSPIPRPARSRILRAAGITPVSISSGSSPITAKWVTAARGLYPIRRASPSSARSIAPAPSVTWLALPAATRQPISGNRAAIASS